MQRRDFLKTVSASAALAGCGGAPGEAPEFDVVIYGGSSAAMSAAVQSVRMGKKTVVVSPVTRLGGLTSGGLGWTDSGRKEVIGGVAREFYQAVWKHYDDASAWRWQARDAYGNKGQGTPAIDGDARTMWIFEPSVAAKVYENWVTDEKLDVRRDEWLDRAAGVELGEGGRILAIKTLSGARYSGRMFLDCTYEGDLMAAAGVSYHVGREGNEVYGERHNGVQKDVRHHGHYFPENTVSPYVKPGDRSSGLVPRVHDGDPGENGQGDKRIQAYCYRLCMTQVEENRIPFEKPEGYDPFQYELLARVLEAGWNETFHKFDPIPNGKTDTNNHGPFSTDNIGMNYDYPEASYERRREILREHELYERGWAYFLTSDPRVPTSIREEMSKWGLAADEFPETNGWPHQIYVREARRMVGQYVMTELDCLSERDTPESVGMGSYTADSHNVQRYVTAEGFVQNEGDIGVHLPGPYRISYRSLTPQRGECPNLLTPVCCSTSHAAFGSVRMEPVFMILGQSAATAAVMAMDGDMAVQDLSYSSLRERLLADGQVLEAAEG